MKTELSILIKMQKIDDKIAELDILKHKLPKQLEQLISNVTCTKENVILKEKKLEENILSQKVKENDIKTNNDAKIKYLHQLEGIKNNKEYKALNKQIETLSERNISIEAEQIILMEEENEIREQITEAETLKKLAEENLKANENILKQEIEKVDKEIEKHKEDRTELAKNLPVPLIKKYVQLIKNKNLKAVSYIVIRNKSESCSGCGFHIRPQMIIELKNSDKMIYCENCGRILVEKMGE
jgi:predicted  nucleic acid-binding Zn-ribbon protein